MAASGTTKRISINNILACSPTATLASATITGDLTVDTNVLKVDTTNNVVGIGTTTPNSYAFNDPAKLVIANDGTAGAGNTFSIVSGSTGFGNIAFANGTSGTARFNGYIAYNHSSNFMAFYTNAGAERYRLGSDGTATWSVGGSTAMTLNSTGLGVGTSTHTVKLGVVDTSNTFAASFRGSGGTNLVAIGTTSFGASINAYTAGFAGTADLVLQPNGGNVGVGITPAVRLDLLVADAAEATRFRAASGWLRIHPYLNATDNCRLQAVNGTNSALIPISVEGLTVRLNSNFGNAVTIDNLGNTISNVNSAIPSLGTNSQMVFNLTSNTNLRISVRGTDGTTRVANITLA
jgi:hypothetical protein